MALPFRRNSRNPNQKFEDLKQAALNARLPYDKDAYLNLAFYLDQQYTEWNAEASSIRQIPRSDRNRHAPRPVVNKIMHFVNQQHASALQARPSVDVLPATDDPVDATQSGVSLAYLQWLSESQVTDFDAVLSEAALWALVVGEGYMKWVYNPKLKRPDIIAPSYFDILVDPYAKTFNNARYVIHSQFMDVEQVYDVYDKEMAESAVQRTDTMRTGLLREMGQAPVLSGVEVNELWMKPNRRYKDGLYVVWAGKEMLVEPRPYPYQHGRLPFTQLGSIPRPGTYHYSSAVKYLRSPQMELNKYHAQRLVTRENFANPKWWIPSELELETDPDSSPNQILRGAGQAGLKPEIIQPSQMPHNDDGAWLVEEMMNVVGVHEVSQGTVPGRVEAATAIELLKESDATRQAELQRSIQQSISEGYWQCLMLAKQYVSEEQIVQTYSREGVPEVKRFKTEDFKPGMRIRVTMGTGLARSRAARQEQLIRLWDSKVINDPETMAELLEVPIPSFISNKAHDIRLARNENYDMSSKNVAITPNSWDDHELHIREHNNFRKTQEFLTLANEVKQKFEYHVQTHEQQQLQQLAKMAEKQMIMQQAAMPPEEAQEQTQPQQTPGGEPEEVKPPSPTQ